MTIRSAFVQILVSVLLLLWASSSMAKEVHFRHVQRLLAGAPVLEGSRPAPLNVSMIGKPIVVTFFASWCPPCTQEFAHLNEVRHKYSSDKVSIIGINAFENFGTKRHPARMRRFLKRTKPMFPLVVGDDALLKAFSDITRIPTVIVFDKTGKEIWRFVHVQNSAKRFSTTKEILAALEGALN